MGLPCIIRLLVSDRYFCARRLTHEDVYKRQSCDCPDSRVIAGFLQKCCLVPGKRRRLIIRNNKQEIPGQMEYTVLATAHYTRVTENVWKSLVIGLGVVVLAVLAILILYILAKKRRERGRKTERINLRRT